MSARKSAGREPGLVMIGWKEYLDLTDWGIERVKVKVDTGARTSALDALRCDLEQRPAGLFARLELALHRRRPERVDIVEAPVRELVMVTSSSGLREQRPVVETTIRLGPVSKRIRLTITRRAGMLFRMLLGREALAGTFVVDVGRKYLQRGNG